MFGNRVRILFVIARPQLFRDGSSSGTAVCTYNNMKLDLYIVYKLIQAESETKLLVNLECFTSMEIRTNGILSFVCCFQIIN